MVKQKSLQHDRPKFSGITIEQLNNSGHFDSENQNQAEPTYKSDESVGLGLGTGPQDNPNGTSHLKVNFGMQKLNAFRKQNSMSKVLNGNQLASGSMSKKDRFRQQLL